MGHPGRIRCRISGRESPQSMACARVMTLLLLAQNAVQALRAGFSGFVALPWRHPATEIRHQSRAQDPHAFVIN